MLKHIAGKTIFCRNKLRYLENLRQIELQYSSEKTIPILISTINSVKMWTPFTENLKICLHLEQKTSAEQFAGAWIKDNISEKKDTEKIDF